MTRRITTISLILCLLFSFSVGLGEACKKNSDCPLLPPGSENWCETKVVCHKNDGVCRIKHNTSPCSSTQYCDQALGRCHTKTCHSDNDCDNGRFCDGTEICNKEGICVFDPMRSNCEEKGGACDESLGLCRLPSRKDKWDPKHSSSSSPSSGNGKGRKGVHGPKKETVLTRIDKKQQTISASSINNNNNNTTKTNVFRFGYNLNAIIIISIVVFIILVIIPFFCFARPGIVLKKKI